MISKNKEKLSKGDYLAILTPFIFKIIEDAIYQDSILFGKGFAFYGFFYFLIYTLIFNYKLFVISFKNNFIKLCALFLVISFIIESFHKTPRYIELLRVVFMMASIPLYVSWILKNKQAIYYILGGFVIWSIIMALNLTLNVSLLTMLDYGDSEAARVYATEKMFFIADLNLLGYLSGTIMFICFLYSMESNLSKITKNTFLIISILSGYALICTVSRSGFVNVFIILMVLAKKYKLKIKFQYLIFPIIFILLTSVSNLEKINGLIFSRFETIDLNDEKSEDSRTVLYSKLYGYLGEVYLFGVGEGGYFGEWGANSSLSKVSYSEEKVNTVIMMAAHNSFLQILFYWGIIPVVIYVLIYLNLFYMLPISSYKDILSKSVTILLIFSFMMSLFLNNFAYKEHSVVCSLILGLNLRKKYHLDNE
jgi:hypothetical protein